MEEITSRHCTYYGNLEGTLFGPNLGDYAVDEAFNRLLEKYGQDLLKSHVKLSDELTQLVERKIGAFHKRMNALSVKIDNLSKRITVLSKDKKDKEKQELDNE